MWCNPTCGVKSSLTSCHTMWVHTERAVFVLDLNPFQILLIQWQLAYTYRTHMLCCMWFIIVVITRNYSVTTRLTRMYVVTVSSTKFWFRILPAFGCVVAVHKPCSTHGWYVIYAYVDCTHCGVSVLASASTHTRSIDRVRFCDLLAAPRFPWGVDVRVPPILALIIV